MKSRLASPRFRLTKRSKRFVMVSHACCVVATMYATIELVKSKSMIVLQAAVREKGLLDLRNGLELEAEYGGDAVVSEALRTGSAQLFFWRCNPDKPNHT